MKHSWLVQRLTTPRGQMSDNPFSLGGGLQNGGLSKDAMMLLRPIFGFDYMGAAEFEFGAVPKAFEALAKKADRLVAKSISIPLAEVEKHWSDRTRKVPTGEADVYVLCDEGDAEEVEKRIRNWAAAPHLPEFSTKESVGLSTVLRPDPTYESRTRGWIELDNGFMFFTDRKMWAETSALFGVEVADEATS